MQNSGSIEIFVLGRSGGGGTLYTMAYSGRHPPHGKGYLFWASDERVGVEVYERVGK